MIKSAKEVEANTILNTTIKPVINMAIIKLIIKPIINIIIKLIRTKKINITMSTNNKSANSN